MAASRREATMLRRALAASSLLVLTGCAINDRIEWSELNSSPREFFNLNPPVLVTGESVAGERVVLKQGQALIVRLPEDARSGRAWRMRPLPTGPLIAPVRHDFTARPGIDPAAPGGLGEATFRLRGVAPGTQAVTLDYVRPGFVQPERSLAFDVTVR